MNEQHREIIKLALFDLESKSGVRWGPEYIEEFAAAIRAALAEIDRLRAEVAALKAHDSLAEMWAALAEYQPQADANGHGESWRKMCEERTEEAAAAAYRSPQTLSRIAHAAYNAWWASQRDAAARSTSKEAVVWATNAVAAIRRAKEAKP
jgi:hypothetical protein